MINYHCTTVLQRCVWRAFLVNLFVFLLFCGTSVHMPNERIKNSSHICPQTMGCQRSQASSHASPGSWQLTDREETIPACVCLPTFQHHHHLLLGTAGRLLLHLLLCGAAGRRIVSLEQLVHLPLHLWWVALAVALGDGEPLAHGGRRQTGSLFRRCERDEKMKKKNKKKL